jgi:ABC-type transport system involved in cytochrome c biogenesis permease subunit
MKLWIERFASLKLTVVLLLALGVMFAAATIVESMRGAAAAQAVYYSPWLLALEALFGVNLLAALVERWPRNRWRVGFALTHASMLMILVGALMTWAFKIEGRLPIWEGEASSLVYRAGTAGDEPYELPFRVRLDAFEIDTYPGTRRPAMFRSRVVVLEGSGAERPAVIEMNRPLAHGGFELFQSSYQIQGGREMTVLQVSRDPGQAIVFLGYTLLVAGMIIVFFTRLAQHRRLAQLAAGAPGAAVVLALATFAAAAPARAALVPDAAATERARAVAVQDDGRAMPFDTQARNAVWEVTRLRSWPGVDPVAMALGWAIDPQGWQGEPIVRVRRDVATLAGLASGTRYASYRELVASRPMLAALGAAEQRQQAEQPLSPLDKHLLETGERLTTLQSYFQGERLRAAPATDPTATWGAVRPRTAAEFVAAGERARAAAPRHYPSRTAIERELTYNRARPSRLAWWLLVPAALAAGLTLGRERWGLGWVARLGVVAGFAVMTWGLALRWQIAGRIPASNMYESMLFLAWGVGLFALLSVALGNRMLVFNAAAMSALAIALLDLLPMDPFLHPMPPVLSGTPWLAIHVPIIMVGYATLTLVTFFAHLVVGVEIFAPARRDLVERWSQLAYWYLHVGSILLLTGILTGSIWAASSWGRYWGWDPKEVWSLVAFLAYMAILHARFDQQIHHFGVAVGAIAAFWTILMTYLGVNFVLAAGLHSYGFGSSNLVNIMGAILVVEVAFLGAGWLAVRRRLRAVPAAL